MDDWTFINPEELAAASREEKEAARKMVEDLLKKVKAIVNELPLESPEWDKMAHLEFKLQKLSIDLFEI